MNAQTHEIRRSNRVSRFSVESPKGRFDVVAIGFPSRAGGWATVQITKPDGSVVEHRGSMEIERGGKLRADQVPYAELPIRNVRVSSLGGDVVGTGKTARAATEDYATQVVEYVIDGFTPPAPEPTELQRLVDRDTFTGSGSAALGVAVSARKMGDLSRHFLGVIVEIPADRQGAWVRRYTDPKDVSVFYGIGELELATKDDLVEAARYFLHGQYAETRKLAAALAAAVR